MTSSGRSRLAAITVFVLIAFVVLAGMTWASVSSFELAKKTVTEKHNSRINRALVDMTGYMAGILYSEASRPYTDYKAVHVRRALAVYSSEGVELNAAFVELPSPLISGPPQHWMDLNFHLSPDGRLTSPQFPDETGLISLDTAHFLFLADHRTRRVWEWVKTVLPGVNLHEQVAQACRYEEPVASVIASMAPVDAIEPSSRERGGRLAAPGDGRFEQRKRSLRDTQANYLPAPACEDARIAARNVRDVRGSMAAGTAESAASIAGDVETRPDPFMAFWLGKGPGATQKLAFVREVHSDASVFYQGFIGDWARLKPELLKQIQNPIPGTDMEPVHGDADSAMAGTGEQMPNLPVRLVIPDMAGGASSAAWQKVRGTLITMWAATAAVLAVAGFGLRNLVALTERRMHFAYAVTHELRTPLTTFRLYSDMLSAGLVPESSKQEYLDTLNQESQRLSSLVEGVLEYARLENQKVKLNPSDTDGPTLLSGIVENLEERCAENGIEARAENTLTNGRRLHIDVDVVTRIAGVLVNNACRHARGGDAPSVLVRLGGDHGVVYLDVVDSGSGIDRADARAIFRPFRRGRKADSAAQGGIGLGLALARNWADLLGGKLELAARHHAQLGGAHFRLTLPAR